MMCLNTAGRATNNVDLDQAARFAASDLGLHRLLRHVVEIFRASNVAYGFYFWMLQDIDRMDKEKLFSSVRNCKDKNIRSHIFVRNVRRLAFGCKNQIRHI